ncbi:MAG TPA: hypothetical protein DDY86_04720 [Syntrophaceae bacterium]|nr:hypothetical protein [Syntrophaceae bacterium]
MKKLFISLFAVLFLVIVSGDCFASGTSPTTPAVIRDSGVSVSIVATASATTAYFLPALISPSSNYDTYRSIVGKWLTSILTTPSYPGPTANYDIYIVEGVTATSDFVLNSPTLAIGSTTTHVSTVAFNFVINGVQYYKAAVAAGTAPGNDVIAQSKYGAVAFDIGADGTIDAIEATGQAAAQFTTAAAAVAALPAAASDHVRLGWVTATKSDGAFTFGGTALSAVNSTVVYYSTVPQFDITGGALQNRSATAAESTYPRNTTGDNMYHFTAESLMVIPVNNAVNSAVVTIKLKFN